MKNIRIGLRLIVCFLLVSALAVVLGLVGRSAMNHTVEALDRVSGGYLPSIESLARVRYSLSRINAAQKALLVSGLKDRDTQHKAILESRDTYVKALADYEALPKSANEAAALKTFEASLTEARESNAKALNAIKDWEKDRADEARYEQAQRLVLEEFDPKFQKSMDALAEVIRINMGNAARDDAESDAQVARDGTMMTAIMIVVPLLSLGAGILLTLSITRPLGRCVGFAQDVAAGRLEGRLKLARRDELGVLAGCLDSMVDALVAKIAEADDKGRAAEAEAERARQAMDEAQQAKARAESAKREGMLQAAQKLEGVVEIVTSASEELSAQIEQSSRGADQQSQRTDETATAMDEMNATVLEVARNASTAAETSEGAKQKAEEGEKVVEEVVSGIGDVQRQTLALKDEMATLGRRAESIGEIMNVITDIADQTNLLALNAAIEAARAGDAGRGFAVVADEVRKLAEKTMNATKEVGEAIRGIQGGTRESAASMEQAAGLVEKTTGLASASGRTLREIVRLVETSADQVRAIATASEEQSSASEEINRSIEDVRNISSETADAMRQSAQAVGELANQAGVLKALIEEMKREGTA